jgi:hypothetical protein
MKLCSSINDEIENPWRRLAFKQIRMCLQSHDRQKFRALIQRTTS